MVLLALLVLKETRVTLVHLVLLVCPVKEVNLVCLVRKEKEELLVLLAQKAPLESKENAVFKELWVHLVHQVSLLKEATLDHLDLSEKLVLLV